MYLFIYGGCKFEICCRVVYVHIHTYIHSYIHTYIVFTLFFAGRCFFIIQVCTYLYVYHVCSSSEEDILAVAIGESLRLPYYKNKIILSGLNSESEKASSLSRSRFDFI